MGHCKNIKNAQISLHIKNHWYILLGQITYRHQQVLPKTLGKHVGHVCDLHPFKYKQNLIHFF